MKRLFFILLLLTAIPAWSQTVDYTDHQGRVVDATTGKPLPNAKVTHAIGGQSDAKGRFTVRYYSNDSDKRVIVSHPGYCTDTFSIAPTFVSLRRMTSKSQKNRPKVAVVLSGGGAKGVAHIGALKVIEEAGIPIDMICGTSMGALVGALYCVGYSTDFLDSLVRSQDWAALLSDRTDPTNLTLRQREEQNTYAVIRGIGGEQPQRGGLIRGRNLNMLFHRLCSEYLDSISFDSLPIPFACVATDIVTNKEVVFHNGHLIQAMRASMAIPGVFTPVRIGDMVLLDGGLRNNYPADVARAMGADIVIGISVQDLMTRSEDINDVGAVMGQLISINSRNKFTDNIKLSDIFIHVDVSGYSAASFTNASIDTLLRRGEEATQALWGRLLALRQNHHIDSVPYPLPDAKHGIPAMDDKPTPATTVTRIPIASAGFRFDSEEMGAIQLAVKMPLPGELPMGVTGTVRLGKRLMARAEATMLTPLKGFNPTLAYTFRNNDIDLYTAGSRTYNVRYRQHTVELNPLDLRLRRYDLRAGARWDYYNFYGQLLSAGGTMPSVDDDSYISYYAKADLNTENDWYFPTRGNRFHAAYTYHTTNFYGFDNGIGLSDITAHWRINLPFGNHWTFQPMLYGRLLWGGESPLAFYNIAGGEWFGHTVEQQLPFAGIGHAETCERNLAAIQMQLQCQLFKNQYLLLRIAGAYQTADLSQLGTDGLFFGAQAGYSLSTIIGPVDARIGYSSHTRKPYFFINIGHIF
ncbi:MAG: patatin-like phospholipase family protein [Bacteroidales bacterium]|nr:patatin-like phospholipase family protein [Bacteroidales bacterium]